MENNKQENQNEIKISKKNIYIFGGIISALLIIGGIYLFSNKNGKDKNIPENKIITDSSSIKKDSTQISKIDSIKNNEEYNEEEYQPYGEYRIIENEISLPNGQKLKFGSLVYKDFDKSTPNNSIIYLNNPKTTPSTKSYPISLSEESMIDSYSFDDFKNKFSLSPYSSLPVKVKKLLISKEGFYHKNDRKYFITQNAERAKSTLATGDFDGDGLKDIAVLLDDNERQESLILIIAMNKVTKDPYIAFSEGYDDKLKVKSFAKGASIYMNSNGFVKAPREGVLISNEYGSIAILYDANAQKFKSYNQSPAEEPTAEADSIDN